MPSPASPNLTPPSTSPERWLSDHGELLWRYAQSRVDDPHAAEELVQETLLNAWRTRETFRGGSTERTWLVGILRHKIADWARKRGREGARPDPAFDQRYNAEGFWAGDAGDWPVDPEHAMRSPEFWRVFERCLSRLPAAIAETFVMREVRGVATEGVCEAMGISSENLWVRLHRARQTLRDCLALHWREVKGGAA